MQDKVLTQRRIFYSLIIAFFAWLVLIFAYVIPRLLVKPETIDPMVSLMAVFGMGGVTTFFTTMLTLVIQFFVRKKPPTTPTEPPQP